METKSSRRADADRQPTRRRSRSPRDEPRDAKRRRRSRSEERRSRHDATKHAPRPLPYDQGQLSKKDLSQMRPVFAEYLDVQKRLEADALAPEELKGRFKSFVGKWNRGELAEGWYDPTYQITLRARYATRPSRRHYSPVRRDSEARLQHSRGAADISTVRDNSDGEDEDDFGPALPSKDRSAGVTIPSVQDLQHRRELDVEEREHRLADARSERKQERKQQKERLDELVPRAAPGTRERQLEKKREAAAGNRAFAEAKASGGDVAEVPDADLMGADDEGAASFKAQLKAQATKKNEREIRKEEILRARAAEREERLAGHRQKEEKTMDMLRALAKQRFG